QQAHSLTLTPPEAIAAGIQVNGDGQRRSLIQLLAYDSCSRDRLEAVWTQVKAWSPVLYEQLEIEALYSGYMARQRAEIDSFRKDEDLQLPEDMDYMQVPGLSNEARERLSRLRPQTLGQARRMEGLTVGALTTLLFYIRNQNRRSA